MKGGLRAAFFFSDSCSAHRRTRVSIMASQDDCVELLARFPGPVTLYPSRKKWLLVFAGSAGFVALGYWIIQKDNWVGWGAVIFFGLGMLVSAATLLPGAGTLTLDREGFEAKSLFRRRRARWRNVSRVEVWELSLPRWHPRYGKNLKNVVYDDAERKNGAMAATNVAVCGHNSGLPDTYGFSADDLVQLMVRWRERALS
jgi:hypothetical protein